MESESQTSVGVAALRAAHLLFDPPPHVLEDPVAVRLLGPEVIAGLRDDVARLHTPLSLGLRAHVVLRSRYAEDCAAQAAARGVRRIVALGAGLDTFAYRQPAWARPLRVLEVDHPESQRGKRRRLEAAGIAIPANVELVPVDFEATTLESALGQAEPSFFSWLGVTPYLSEAAIDAVLRFVAGHPKGTELVFTFARREASLGSRMIEMQAGAAGEPWRSRFEPEELAAKLRGHGFAQVAFLEPEQARERYFRESSLPAPRQANIASARVG